MATEGARWSWEISGVQGQIVEVSQKRKIGGEVERRGGPDTPKENRANIAEDLKSDRVYDPAAKILPYDSRKGVSLSPTTPKRKRTMS